MYTEGHQNVNILRYQGVYQPGKQGKLREFQTSGKTQGIS
jgi:hypothetical protein